MNGGPTIKVRGGGLGALLETLMAFGLLFDAAQQDPDDLETWTITLRQR
jgi:hypothetical protein